MSVTGTGLRMRMLVEEGVRERRWIRESLEFPLEVGVCR